MKRHWDVIVAGLGAMGSATAYHLARQRASVLGLDRYAPPHGYGSSHGYTRTIRFAYAEGSGYVPLVKRAHLLWRALEDLGGQRLLTTTGGLTIGRQTGPAVSGARRSAERHGLEFEILNADEVRRRYPALATNDGQAALFEPNAGVLHPEICIGEHLRAARLYGAEFLTDTAVQSWSMETPSKRVHVHTAAGEFTAERLVVAVGAWASALIGNAGLPLSPRRVYQFWIHIDGADRHFLPPLLPAHFWELDDGSEIYGHPALHGAPGVKIAFHNRHQDTDPNASAGPPPETLAKDMAAFLHRHLPTLDGRPWTAAPCLYTLSPDHHFIIGPLPNQPEIIVATGFSGHGFKFASAVGEAVAETALGATGVSDISAFSAFRFPS